MPQIRSDARRSQTRVSRAPRQPFALPDQHEPRFPIRPYASQPAGCDHHHLHQGSTSQARLIRRIVTDFHSTDAVAWPAYSGVDDT